MDADAARIMNASLMGIALLGSGLAVLYAARSESAYRRTARWAERTRLALIDDTDPLWPRIAAHIRRAGIAEGMSLVVASAIAMALVPTSVGGDPQFILAVFLPTVVVVNLTTMLATGLGERLFSPAAEATRVARVRSLRPVDYLGPARIAVTWTMMLVGLVLAVVLAATWIRSPAQVEVAGGRAAFVVAGLALIVSTALPWVERSILSRPQPASSALQLAWDDALRAGVLATAHLAVATLWLVVALLAVQALWGAGMESASAPTPMSFAGLLMVALSQVYPTEGFEMRVGLRPRSAVTA